MTDIDIDVFGLKIRIHEAGKQYKKSDGTQGITRDGIAISCGSGYITPSALQLAGLIEAFAPGTEARKEAARRVRIEQEAAGALKL